jgi:hypothetical protein
VATADPVVWTEERDGLVDLAVGVTRGEQIGEAGAVVGVEALRADGQQLAAPRQRVGFAAPVAEGALLDPAAGAVHNPGRRGSR